MILKILRSRVVWLLLLALVLGLAAVTFYRVAQRERDQNWLLRGRAALEQKQWSNAAFYAKLCLQQNPDNLAAMDIMAEVSNEYSPQEALPWRRRMAEVSRMEGGAVLRWAGAAMLCQDLRQVEEALGRLPPEGLDQPEAKRLRGALALQRKDLAAAEKEFAALAASPKAVDSDRISLYSVRLFFTTNESQRADSRQQLAALISQPAVRVAALRSLLSEAIVQNHPDEARRWLKEYWATPNLSMREAIFGLEAAESLTPDEVEMRWKDVRVIAGQDPWIIYRLMKWMNYRNRMADTLEWGSLLGEMAKKVPVAEALAEASLRFEKWDVLVSGLQSQQWGDRECFRHAYLALAYEKKKSREVSQELWRTALRETRAFPAWQWKLGELAMEWNWDAAALLAWSSLAEGRFLQEPALQKMYLIHRRRQDTPSLLQVFERLEKLDPKNGMAQNNVNYLKLLLRRDLRETLTRAESLVQVQPENPAYLSTLALALVLNGSPEEALKLIERLPKEFWKNPEIAPYVVLILERNGKSLEAASYRPFVQEKMLLPEEMLIIPK